MTLSTATKHPWLFAKSAATLSLGPLVSSESLVRDLFFTTDTPGQLVTWTSERLMAESYVAYLDVLRGAPSHKVKGVPILLSVPTRTPYFHQLLSVRPLLRVELRRRYLQVWVMT